jgi:hypothetical protein
VSQTQSPIIQSDLPCSGCKYKLCGLPADAKCPECGQSIALTLLTMLQRNGDIAVQATLSPKVRTTFRDGLILLLISAACTIAAALAPESMLDFNTTGRRFMLALLCTAWVSSCWGVWKIGVPVGMLGMRDPISRRFLRVTAVMLIVLSALSAPLLDKRHPWSIHSGPSNVAYDIALGLLLFFIGPLLLLRVQRLCRKLGATMTAGAASVAACTWPAASFWTLFVMPSHEDGDSNSLDFLMDLPAIPAAPADYLRVVINDFDAPWYDVHAFFYFVLLPALITVAVIAAVLIVILRSPRVGARP